MFSACDRARHSPLHKTTNACMHARITHARALTRRHHVFRDARGNDIPSRLSQEERAHITHEMDRVFDFWRFDSRNGRRTRTTHQPYNIARDVRVCVCVWYT